MSSCASSSGDFSDWQSSVELPTKSLFDDSVHQSPQAAVEHDKLNHGWSLSETAAQLSLDDYQVIRLVNYIRRTKRTAHQLSTLSSQDPLFSDDSNLKPELEDDPLLQLAMNDESWSDDEGPQISSSKAPTTSKPTQDDLIDQLRAELAQEQIKVKTLQSLISRDLDGDVSSDESSESESESDSDRGKGKGKAKRGKKKEKKRDDDTHYFDSYASNGIHQIMLRDAIRTVSYGRFILSNPAIFKDAVVLDVGCGTGILSLFAAKAGAKQVIAIEASGLASKARENIKANGMQNIITVVQGKVEEVAIPVKQCDVIISEWMGYALLYESMFDSVIYAREKYLRPNGLMVPSQTKILVAGSTSARLESEEVDFWNSVYGFDLSAMKPRKFDEGIVEVIPAEEVVTTTAIVKDINSHVASVADLDFTAPFKIAPSSSAGPTTFRSFVTWFDTFFSPDSSPAGQAPGDEIVQLHDFVGWDTSKRLEPVSDANGGVSLSFTTGPNGQATHWKQVTFMLSEEVILSAGQSITGTVIFRKSSTNSRELEVEFHWAVEGEGTAHNRPRYEVSKVA